MTIVISGLLELKRLGGASIFSPLFNKSYFKMVHKILETLVHTQQFKLFSSERISMTTYPSFFGEDTKSQLKAFPNMIAQARWLSGHTL